MSADAFATLDFPRRLVLSMEEIEGRWRELSRESHPDSDSGDSDRAADVNRAYETLRSPGSRLRHWLELNAVEIPRNASIDEDLMAQFTEIGSLLALADAFMAKKNAATSAIAKALIADEEFAVQKDVQNRMGHLKAQIEAISDQFNAFEADYVAAVRGLEKLRFLEKWNQQCQERLVSILSS
ncbi:hypothetical protein OAK43_01285 [Verrucomicrobiales bacterium]|nr:hypothetical protein [Verrucomicrobiales bacterium]MDC0258843.1 hypothetical protein [Verrucomicrobiales bacterium]